MFFLVDIFLLAVLICVIFASVKFGFSRNFVFGILRTVIALGGGAALAFGVYMLMDSQGWLAYMSDGVRKFFGEVSSDAAAILSDAQYRFAAKLIAYIPFGLLFFVLGYVIAYYLIKVIVSLFFSPVLTCVKKIRWVKIVDNVLGLLFNLAVYVGAVGCLFGAVHALNEDGVYTNVAAKGETEESVAKDLVNNFCEPILTALHEDFSASVVGGLVYEYNPLNKTFKQLIASARGK